ncbi:hypothetical protein CPC08DRAFT_533056 [Agrocybe pediades]|nr:hypothetical protein CPC08DRAFT_533056 [Agrocybe pediades]
MAVPEVGGKAFSLPDDRSEWPVFLSGGKLPKVGALAEEEEKQQAVQQQQEQQEQRKAGIVIGANGANTGAMPPFGSIGRAHANSSTRTYALQPRTVTVNAQGTNARGISASAPNGPRMYDYAGVGVARATHVAPGLVGVPNPAASAGRKPQASRNYSGSGSSASRSRSRSGSASASNSNGSDLEAAADDVDIEVDVVGEDVDEDEVDGMSLDGDENVKQKTPSAASAAFTYSPYYPSQQLSGQSPGGYHAAYGSYGSYGSGIAGSFGTPSSAYGGGFSSSYSRRGGSLGLGMGMKREEDEMSIGFSVREEDEEEDEAERSSTREEEEEEEETMSMGMGIGGAMSSKKFGPVSSLRETSVGASSTSARSMSTRKSMRTRTLTEKARERVVVVEERKWDGMEMEVDNMDMD